MIFLTVALMLLLLCGFLAFDHIIRLEYKSYRDPWEADDKPVGFFFFPSELKFNYSLLRKRDKRLWNWMLATPEWITQDKKAFLLLRFVRFANFAWIIGWVYVVLFQLHK